MPACGYEFYLLVFKSISYEWAQAGLFGTEPVNANPGLNQIKILTYPGLASSGFEQPCPGAALLGLAKSIY